MERPRSRFRPVPALLTPALALALAPLAALGGCSKPTDERPNVLLITIDTLRADRLGAWGYDKPTSPSIDALAEQSVVFEHCQSQSSWTLPSLASLFTSLYTSTHGCWNFDSRLPVSFTTLAEHLAANGYATAGVASHVFLAYKYGLHQGFADYDVELVQGLRKSHMAISSPAVTSKGIAWLEEHGESERPWFLWVHYFDPHEVYQPHPGFVEEFGEETEEQLYDGEIAFTDRAIGKLLEKLRVLRLAGDTIVVLLADHGEEWEDHGKKRHGHTLYQELVHVPLLVRAPGFQPRRVATGVRVVDVLPTLLELTGTPALPGVEGRSLVPAMRGEPVEELPALGELRLWKSDASSLATERWKLIVDREKERVLLFDREADLLELEDVAAEHPEVVEQLRAQLDAMVASAEARAYGHETGTALDLSAEELEHLQELGYGGTDEEEED